MKVGDLVKFRGSIGLIVAEADSSWKPHDWWVKWGDEVEFCLENECRLELVAEANNESR